MKITTLMENTASSDCFTAEHGLSIYIETKDHIILFDSGPSGAFADNAAKLGVDLAKAEMAILSHGHYDHGGGFHFMGVALDDTGKKRLTEAAENLSSYPTTYYTCHCTGLEQYRFMKQLMGDRLHYIASGDIVEI